MAKSDSKKTTAAKAASKKVAKKKVAKKKTAKKVAKKKVTKKKIVRKTASRPATKKASPSKQKKPVMSDEERRMTIALHAYYKWEQAGFPGGQDWQHWLEAEEEVERMFK
jgi:hypothetical protein